MIMIIIVHFLNTTPTMTIIIIIHSFINESSHFVAHICRMASNSTCAVEMVFPQAGLLEISLFDELSKMLLNEIMSKVVFLRT